MEDLPRFRYYPDPVGGGSVEPSGAECAACDRARGYVYTSVAYGAGVPDAGVLCPWCIADGTAHERLGATFNDLEPGASDEVTREVEQRTPGLVTWQDWFWPVHCGEVTLHLGRPRAGELRSYPDAWTALREEIREYDWARATTPPRSSSTAWTRSRGRSHTSFAVRSAGRT